MNEIKFILDYSMIICNYNFYDKDLIFDINKNNYIDESDEESEEEFEN